MCLKLNRECKAQRGSIESLYIALGSDCTSFSLSEKFLFVVDEPKTLLLMFFSKLLLTDDCPNKWFHSDFTYFMDVPWNTYCALGLDTVKFKYSCEIVFLKLTLQDQCLSNVSKS